MRLRDFLSGRGGSRTRSGATPHSGSWAALEVEQLEERTLPAASAAFASGLLVVTGGPGNDRIDLILDAATNEIVVLDAGQMVGRFDSGSVNTISIAAGIGDDLVSVAQAIVQALTIDGEAGNDTLQAGSGPATLLGGDGDDVLIGGPGADILLGEAGDDKVFGNGGPDVLDGGLGKDKLFGVSSADTVTTDDPGDKVFVDPTSPAPPPTLLETTEVEQLLQRAAGASPSNDAIIAIVDRNGRILGVRVESGVSPAITGNIQALTFAIDGAVAKARTAAYFANNQAPLTSRTVQFISQSAITQREVESNPSISDPNSVLRGPGFVAPVGPGGHFPPGVAFTPQVDLFEIEHTNRDSILHPVNGVKGDNNDVLLPARFNIDPAFIPPGVNLFAPESYGFQSGLFPTAQARGIATLPGGIPIYDNGNLVGGIGVFFPGQTGFATEENSSLSAIYDPTKPDRTLEAEYIGIAAVGGVPSAGFAIGTIAGIPAIPGFGLPSGRIDLVGITLNIFGPQGTQGLEQLIAYGIALGTGDPNSGTNQQVDPTGATTLSGLPVPEGWLVLPHDGVGGLTTADVSRIINQGIIQAVQTRAAIRLPLGSSARFMFAVTDVNGEVLGLFRMPDTTFFSIDVAVAKGRNVAYYADPLQLQPIDQVPGVPPGVAFTNRTFRYLAEPRFPEAIDGNPPGPFSIFTDPGQNRFNGLNIGPPQPASAFQSVQGFDAFNPQTNFRDPSDPLNQNGIVFFPGSTPLYKNGILVGGLGVSGDGVDQDDVNTFAAALGYAAPGAIRSDQFFFRSTRLPFQKFNRNPDAVRVGG